MDLILELLKVKRLSEKYCIFIGQPKKNELAQNSIN